MKGSEYIAARAGIAFLGMAAGGSVVAVTALFVAPRIVAGLSTAMPDGLAGIGGLSAGLSVVVLVAILMGRSVRYVLARFEQWVVDHGGIED